MRPLYFTSIVTRGDSNLSLRTKTFTYYFREFPNDLTAGSRPAYLAGLRGSQVVHIPDVIEFTKCWDETPKSSRETFLKGRVEEVNVIMRVRESSF